MKALIITTKFTWPDNQMVAELTKRCEQSCLMNALDPILFKAITVEAAVTSDLAPSIVLVVVTSLVINLIIPLTSTKVFIA